MISGIVQVDKSGNPVTGLFERDYKTIQVYSLSKDTCVYAKSYDVVKDIVLYSHEDQCYFFKKDIPSDRLKWETFMRRQKEYPYCFEQEYEAVDHFGIFKDKFVVKNNSKYIGASRLNYTFGLEFETSIGAIPEDQCFINGLIPLRDGSISGNEYSTIVMKGREGINLLQQQIEVLKQYTHFNKECSLHMHFGGFPVDRKYLGTLYSLLYLTQDEFKTLGNRYIYNTEEYKRSGKSYCQRLPEFSSFDNFYKWMTGIKFTGDLYLPHPADPEKKRKWQIETRYMCVNFVNMMCYNGPKTVEFRFLRPTFNFTKIYTWILIFNALLKFAEILTKEYGELTARSLFNMNFDRKVQIGIKSIISQVYAYNTAKVINERVRELNLVSKLQDANGDYAGADTTFEDRIMTYEYKS